MKINLLIVLLLISQLLLHFASFAQKNDELVQTDKHWLAGDPGAYNHTASGQLVWNTNVDQYWHGVWSEDANKWRVQLCFITNASNGDIMELLVQVGSVSKHSGGGYLRSPNGKFSKFELLDTNGKVVPPKLGAGTNLLGLTLKKYFFGIIGQSNWLSSPNVLEENFQRVISTNLYPRNYNGEIAGYVTFLSNGAPGNISRLALKDLYSISNEGDYTLTVCPTLFKQYNHTNDGILDRVDLPCVTTKIHLKCSL